MMVEGEEDGSDNVAALFLYKATKHVARDSNPLATSRRDASTMRTTTPHSSYSLIPSHVK